MNQCQSDKNYNKNINDSSNIKKNTFVKHKPLLSFFYVCLNAITTGFLSVLVKKIPYINTNQLAMFRNIGIFVGALPIAVYTARECIVEKKDKLLLSLRGFFSVTAYYMLIIAYRNLPLVIVAVVMSAQPPVTAILANLWLKEACGFGLTISLILTIFGVLLSVRLPEIIHNTDGIPVSLSYLGGLAAAITAVLLRSFGTVSVRKLRHVHFSIALLYAGFIGITENAAINAAAFPFDFSNCGWDQVLFMLVGILGFMEAAWRTLAVQKQPAALVAVEKSSLDIIISVVFQILFFYEYPDIYVICGACLVILSLGIIGFRNWLLMMPEDSSVKKKLKCFMN